MKSKEKILLTQLQLLKHKKKRLKEESLRRINKSKRTQKKRKVVSDYYNIRLDRGRKSRKFKVKQNVYTVSFHPLRNLRMILFAVFYETFSIKLKNVCNVILTIFYD